MRRYSLFFSCLVLMVAACKKSSSDYSGSKGCITRTNLKLTDILLNAADYDTATRLLSANHLPLDSIQPYSVVYRDPDSAGNYVISLSARWYINGLPLNIGIVDDRFYKGQLLDSQYHFHGVLETTDTAGTLTLEQIRKLFLDSKPDTYSVQNSGAHKKNLTHWADSCVVAMLMYDYKQSHDIYANAADTLAKAWCIFQANNLLLPITIIYDKTSEVFPVNYIID